MTTSSSTLKNELLFGALFLFLLCACSTPSQEVKTSPIPETPFLMVLGRAQDAGYPQAGNPQEYKAIEKGTRKREYAVSLSLIDPETNQRWLFEATPDFKDQLQMVDEVSETSQYPYDGIFLTHAHIGHYTGLIHLGREVMGTSDVPVYAMPQMKSFLESNGPWSQLVALNNIAIQSMKDSTTIELTDQIKVMPFTVPHRDEYSETVGYKIIVNKRSAVFIPDIDKWERWDVDMRAVVKLNDIVLIDASFYADGELKGRDMSQIPHPFTSESMELFKNLSASDRAKVVFIHANHTNPILDDKSKEYKEVISKGFNLAQHGQYFSFH